MNRNESSEKLNFQELWFFKIKFFKVLIQNKFYNTDKNL